MGKEAEAGGIGRRKCYEFPGFTLSNTTKAAPYLARALVSALSASSFARPSLSRVFTFLVNSFQDLADFLAPASASLSASS